MGIYEPTSALPDTNASVGQDCVVLDTCGGDPAPRRGGGGTNTERKGYLFSILSQSSERKQLLCPEASVFMLKGNTKAYKLQLSQ